MSKKEDFPTLLQVTSSVARLELADITRRARYANTGTLILKHGKPFAVLCSCSDYQELIARRKGTWTGNSN